MDRFDVHKPHHAAVPQTLGEPLPVESPSERTGLPSAQTGCPQAEPPGRAESMAKQVEGLQAVLQDSSAALQQELMTAEAKMEVCFLDSLLSCCIGIIQLPSEFVLILCLMYQGAPGSSWEAVLSFMHSKGIHALLKLAHTHSVMCSGFVSLDTGAHHQPFHRK